MSFAVPDLATLIDRIAGDIQSRLPGTDARLRRNLLTVLGRAEAGAAKGLYGHQAWIARQIIVDTAESAWLERWASVWGIVRKAASAATGSATFTGTVGATLPAGTLVARSDGAEFAVDADAAVGADGTVSAALTAQTPGAAGDTDANSTLALVSPVAGIDPDATVDAAAIGGGADLETDAALRARLLSRIQQPPRGGANGDYENWALAVAGVTRVWVTANELGLGTVVVRFVTDDAPGGLIPDAATVQAVADYIDPLRPITADVTVLAPVADALDLTIQLTPNTPDVRTAVEAEIAALLLREAVPGGTILRSHIEEAISIAAGETDHHLLSPLVDVTHGAGHIAVPGTYTWA